MPNKPRKGKRARSSSAEQPDRRWVVGLLVIVAVIAILGYKAVEARSAAPVPFSPESVEMLPMAGPAPAPAATAASAAQQTDPFPATPAEQASWAQRNGKGAMILFHSTNCKPCLIMEDLVKKVRADYEPDVVFVDVVTNNQANLAYVRASGIRMIPTSFFVTRDGQVKTTIGAISEAALRAELARLKAQD